MMINLPLALSLGRNVMQWNEVRSYQSHVQRAERDSRIEEILYAVTFIFDALNTLSYYAGQEVRAFKIIEFYTRIGVLVGIIFRLYRGRGNNTALNYQLFQHGLNIVRLNAEFNHPGYYAHTAQWLVTSALDIGFRFGRE